MSPTSIILKSSISGMCCKIGMARTRNRSLFCIIIAAGLLIFKNDGNGRASRMPIKYPGFENRQIIFFPGSGSFLQSPFSPFYIYEKIFYNQGKTRRTAINGKSNAFAMRFAKYMYPEYASKTVHAILFYTLTNAPNCLKWL